MNPQITSVAGRSPMRRKTLLPRRFRSSVPARRSFASARLSGCEPSHEGYVPVLASSSLLRTTDRISDCPVSALSTESDVLVCNPLAAALFGDFSELSPTAGTSSGSNSSATASTGSQHRRKRRRIPRARHLAGAGHRPDRRIYSAPPSTPEATAMYPHAYHRDQTIQLLSVHCWWVRWAPADDAHQPG